MFWWFVGIVMFIVVTVVVINRRGSTGASRADDRSSGYTPDGTKGTGYVSGDGGGGMAGF